MVTLVFIVIAFVDGLLAGEAQDLYDARVEEVCADVEDKDKCDEDFYGAYSIYTVMLNVAALRIAMFALNAIVIIATWFNQCFPSVIIVSLPWSQLAYAFIFAGAAYMYSIMERAFDVKEGEVWENVKMSGALAVL